MPRHVIGKCPSCEGSVVESSKFFGCDRWRSEDGGCKFTLPKTFAGKELPPFAVRELIQQRECCKLDGFVARSGKNFSARLELVYNGQLWRLKMRFEEDGVSS